ncbi:hypothetical protein NQZ68_017519 [Dissostichus eleginoides]|nr:hypothetical protein NQZ68_017519 [Dissostichus eleginoides]
MWINAKISTISPQLQMCQTPCRGEISLCSEARCLSSFPPAKAVGCMVKIDHYTRIGGRNLNAPPLACKLLASKGMDQMLASTSCRPVALTTRAQLWDHVKAVTLHRAKPSVPRLSHQS